MPEFTSLFSFYGSKSKLAHLYPTPQHDTLIEPFAGSAAYSLRHHERDVLLCDADIRVVHIWRFLLSPDALAWIDRIPRKVKPGQTVWELVPSDAPVGMFLYLCAQANVGTMGTRGTHVQVTELASDVWHRIRTKLHEWLPRIAHWRIMHGSYEDLPDIEATWFVDPPYEGSPGSKYLHNGLNYRRLAKWCKSRVGQVIVCENNGATWLPFMPLTTKRLGIHSSYTVSEVGEALWCNGR